MVNALVLALVGAALTATVVLVMAEDRAAPKARPGRGSLLWPEGVDVYCAGCGQHTLLPYTDANRDNVSIAPLDDWLIVTHLLICPKCAKVIERTRAER